MKARTYKGTLIERDYRGYFTASVYTRDRVNGGHCFQPVQADTLEGIKSLIRYYKGV
jgi:hypothetical protein